MDGILKVFEILPVATLGGAIYYLIKLFVKKSKNHDLDIVSTTPLQEFIERLVITIFFTFLISIIIFSQILKYYGFLETDILGNSKIIAIFITTFTGTFIYIWILWNFSKFINNLFCTKKEFYIWIENEMWKVDQASTKNMLYLSNGIRKYKYEIQGAMEITTDYHQREEIKEVYKKIGLENIVYYRIIGLMLILSIIGGNLWIYYVYIEKILYCIVFSILAIIVLYLFIIGFNEYEFSEKERQNTSIDRETDSENVQ